MSSIAHHASMMALGSASGVDSFDVNDLANYTSGGLVTGTWTMGSGQLSITPTTGSQSTLTRNGISATDSWAEVDITQANDAGVVINWRNSGTNYILATIDDASSNSGNSNRIRLFSYAGGTFTSLGAAGVIAFTRGTQHTVRLQRIGTSIQASFDGVVVATGTDTTNNLAGTRGMRANGNGTNVQSIWNEFRWSA